jgi:hypothetical protein
MAKMDKDLFEALRTGGLRKKVARELSHSAADAQRGRPSSSLEQAVADLRNATSELEQRLEHSQRRQAGQKAARTRKRTAEQRSAAGRKAARTRARRTH